MQARIFIILISIVAIAGACHRKLTTAIADPSPRVQDKAIQAVHIPADFSAAVYDDLRFGREIFDFYARRNFRPFWLEGAARSLRADSMIMLIRSSRRFGLLPQHYHFQEIPGLMLETSNGIRKARLDVVLTDSFLAMMHDLKEGRFARNMSVDNMDSLRTAVLTDSLEPKDLRMALNSQEPRHDQYQLLKGALNTILDSINPTDYDLLIQGTTFDSVDVHRKVRSIEINLERWRRETETLANVYAWINVPAYMFYVVEDHQIAMESQVIVGSPDTPTPMFSSQIECFTVFPYWYVPRKITVNEYLPIIKKDTSFISKNNFDVLDRSGNIQATASIDWRKYNSTNFPFTLRQREGRENSLGVIKFVFDNPYAVFLHDTNAKRLFKNKRRAYSHGCIRLEKAYEFAQYLIGDGRTKVPPRTLDKYLSERKRITISLSAPVQIHIRYFTCEIKDGELLIFDDIYKKDATLIRLLYQQNGTGISGKRI